MTYTINVTAEDIACGGRGNCSRCPVAKALTRCVPGVKESYASYTGGSLYAIAGPGLRVKFPIEVAYFISDFDSGLPVSPFTFTVEIPENHK